MFGRTDLEHNLATVAAELSWDPAEFVPWIERAFTDAGDPCDGWGTSAQLAIVPTTELRRKTAHVLRAVSNEGRFILTRYGRIIGLILPIVTSSETEDDRLRGTTDSRPFADLHSSDRP